MKSWEQKRGYSRSKIKRPMFFAGLAQVYQGFEPDEPYGFVIITANSDQGMVDMR